MTSLLRRAARMATPAVLPLAIVVLWWWATRNETSVYFPPPGDVVVAFKENWLFALVGEHVVPSLVRMFVGFGLAVVLGVALGVPIGLAPTVRRATAPYLSFLRSMPGSAIVIVFLVIFGAGSMGKVLTIAYVAIFPTLLNTIDGVRGVEPTLIDVSTSYRLTRRQHITSVLLPAALPQIFIGVRTSMSLAFIVMVVSEYFAGTNGIGYFTRDSGSFYAYADMWSGMLLLGFLGLLFNGSLMLVQRRVLRWYDGSRARTDSR